jgi:hypothetical protein
MPDSFYQTRFRIIVPVADNPGYRQPEQSINLNGMQPGRKTAPDLQTAALYYPKVLNEILAYAEFCDEHGDEDLAEYKKMESRLHQLTGKDMSAFNLSEWWEEEGAEPLALNFKTYDVRLFQRNKDKSGNYFEYSIAEIAAKLWDNG